MSMQFEKKTNELFSNCYNVGDMLRGRLYLKGRIIKGRKGKRG
jgi:hypothetical protein